MYTIESRFIKTPSKKRIKVSEDLTIAGIMDGINTTVLDFTPNEITDAHLKIEYRVYQDEAVKIDLDKIKEMYFAQGAKDIDIALVRIPRENVRSEKLLTLSTLRDKLVEMASLQGKTLSDAILAKADDLESSTPEQIIAEAKARMAAPSSK